MGGLLYFLQSAASSSCLWPLGSKAHDSTRAGYIPQQPSCGHPSLSSNSLEAAPRLRALCSWLPASFYKLCLYAVSFKSPYTFYCNKHTTARSGLSNGSFYFLSLLSLFNKSKPVSAVPGWYHTLPPGLRLLQTCHLH